MENNNENVLNLSAADLKSFNDWHIILNEFRCTDSYRKSKGDNMGARFFEFLYKNYMMPEKRNDI
jgi:hypothetical protein